MILPARHRAAAALGWRFAAVLAAAALVLAILAAPSERFGVPEPVAAPAAARQAASPPPESGLPPAMDYPAIASHPLFYPSRRPWTPPPPPPAPEPPPPPVAEPASLTGYTLVGVVVSDTLRSALIRADRNKIVTLAEGQEIDGWTLKSITPERLYFTAGDATYEMTGRKPSEIQQ